MAQRHGSLESVRDLDGHLDRQDVLACVLAQRVADLMEHELALLIVLRCAIVKGDLEVAARVHTDFFGATVSAQLDLLLELRLDLDLRLQLHFEVDDLLGVASLARLWVLSRYCGRDLDKLGHGAGISALDVAHYAEETLEVVDLAACLHVVLVVALT